MCLLAILAHKQSAAFHDLRRHRAIGRWVNLVQRTRQERHRLASTIQRLTVANRIASERQSTDNALALRDKRGHYLPLFHGDLLGRIQESDDRHVLRRRFDQPDITLVKEHNGTIRPLDPLSNPREVLVAEPHHTINRIFKRLNLLTNIPLTRLKVRNRNILHLLAQQLHNALNTRRPGKVVVDPLASNALVGLCREHIYCVLGN